MDHFANLEVVKETQDCGDGNCGNGNVGPKTGDPIKDLDKVGQGLGDAIKDENGPGPFVEGLRAMIKNPRAKPQGFKVNRGLVQLPVVGNRGPCGSFNYNPSGGKPNPDYVYTNPLTACVFTAVLQEWKKNICPSHQSGCRIAFGDISHRTDPGFMDRHNTHTDGYCIDIRPMRKGKFENAPLHYTWPGYDRAAMRKLVDLLVKNGGSNIYFNDREIRKEFSQVTKAGGHHNHIHVCFKNNPTTRNACENLKVDPEVCPELQ